MAAKSFDRRVDARNRGDAGSSEREEHPLRAAFDHATRWFGNLLAPLVIVTYARDAQRAVEYLIERPVLTGLFALGFIAVLGYNVFRTADIELKAYLRRLSGKAKEDGEARSTSPENVPTMTGVCASPRHGRALLRWGMVAGSMVALVIVAYAYVTVFVTGLHFVAVASAPNQASAVEEIQALNRYFEGVGRSDLEARAFASTASDSQWYMIAVGGPHTSREAAGEAFRDARRVLGSRMRSDAYIYSTNNLAPSRVIRNWIRRMFRRVFG